MDGRGVVMGWNWCCFGLAGFFWAYVFCVGMDGVAFGWLCVRYAVLLWSKTMMVVEGVNVWVEVFASVLYTSWFACQIYDVMRKRYHVTGASVRYPEIYNIQPLLSYNPTT